MALELGQKWSKYGQKCHKNGLKMIQIWYKQGLKYLKSGLKCDPKPCSFETLPKIAKEQKVSRHKIKHHQQFTTLR